MKCVWRRPLNHGKRYYKHCLKNTNNIQQVYGNFSFKFIPIVVGLICCISRVRIFTILFYCCEQFIRSKLFNHDNMIQWLHFTYRESDYIYIYQRHFQNLVHPSYKHELVWFEIIVDNHTKKIITYNGILEWFEVNHIQWLKHMRCMGR